MELRDKCQQTAVAVAATVAAAAAVVIEGGARVTGC